MSLTSSSWGWNTDRTGLRRPAGFVWLRPFAAAVPWITVGLLLLMLYMISGTYTSAQGLLFDLPDTTETADGERGRLVALVMPSAQATLVFFDDARFVLGDDASQGEFGKQLAERADAGEKALLVLADRRVAGGDLMTLATLARQSGIERILFAARKETDRLE
ncbi:MAG: ExbD/TolR family protein [Kiritimatiellia bacterium]